MHKVYAPLDKFCVYQIKSAVKSENFVRKPFLIGCKLPRVLKFLNFFVKKLCTLRRLTKPESDFRFVQFFLYTLYIAVVLCVLIVQLHADKCDYYAICR